MILIFPEQLPENRIVTGFDLLHIFMRTELFLALFQNGDGDIRALVGDPFKRLFHDGERGAANGSF